MGEGSAHLLSEAETAYTRAVHDPARYSADTIDVLARARLANDPEALVVALRARAWSAHVALDNDAARGLLDEAVRVAERHPMPARLGGLLLTRAITLHELGRHQAARRDLVR